MPRGLRGARRGRSFVRVRGADRGDVRGGVVGTGAAEGRSTGAKLSVVSRVDSGVVAGVDVGVAVLSTFAVAAAIGRRRTDADAAEGLVSASSSAFEERARASVVAVVSTIVAGNVARGVWEARRVHRAAVASGGVGLVGRRARGVARVKRIPGRGAKISRRGCTRSSGEVPISIRRARDARERECTSTPPRARAAPPVPPRRASFLGPSFLLGRRDERFSLLTRENEHLERSRISDPKPRG